VGALAQWKGTTGLVFKNTIAIAVAFAASLLDVYSVGLSQLYIYVK
jgi:hypothetical protein